MIPLELELMLSALTEVLHISCNMGTCDLPETYARSPRAAPSDFGHTFLVNHSCPCYNYKVYSGAGHVVTILILKTQLKCY